MKSKNRMKSRFQVNMVIPYFGVVFVFLLFGILTKGTLFTIPSLMNLVNNGLVILICSVAAVPVFARGDLDFSLGSTEGVCLMLAGYVIQANTRNVWLGFLICLLIGASVGLVNGFVINILKIPAFVATIAMNYILRGLIYTLIDIQEVSYPVTYASSYNVVTCLIIFIIIAVVTYLLMENTKLGKVSRLDGENANAVEFSGLNNNLYGILAFVYLGIAVGIASFLVSPRFTLIQGTVGNTLAVDVLIACMIGGQSMSGGMGSRVSRPIIGSVIISVLNQGYALLNVESSINQCTKGILFIIILAITSLNIGRMLAGSAKRKTS